MTHASRLTPTVGSRPNSSNTTTNNNANLILSNATNTTNLILRNERSECLEGWATDTAFVAHPSRRAEDGAPQDEVGFWVRHDTRGIAR